MIEAIQNEINLSIIVAGAAKDMDIPALEYRPIINPSTAPRPPGSKGIIPTKDATMNTSPMIMTFNGAPNAKNTM